MTKFVNTSGHYSSNMMLLLRYTVLILTGNVVCVGFCSASILGNRSEHVERRSINSSRITGDGTGLPIMGYCDNNDQCSYPFKCVEKMCNYMSCNDGCWFGQYCNKNNICEAVRCTRHSDCPVTFLSKSIGGWDDGTAPFYSLGCAPMTLYDYFIGGVVWCFNFLWSFSSVLSMQYGRGALIQTETTPEFSTLFQEKISFVMDSSKFGEINIKVIE